MDVLARRHRIDQSDPGLMIELDQDDRAVHTIVERAVIVMMPDPGEIRLVEMGFDLAKLDRRMAGRMRST